MKKNDYKNKREEFSRFRIGELINLLSSPDLETRFFAEMALRDATST